MSNQLRLIKNKKIVKNILLIGLGFCLVPFIDIILKSIYTVGTIVGSTTRYYGF